MSPSYQQWTPPFSVVVNNCGGPGAASEPIPAGDGYLPEFTSQADHFLAEGTAPFFSVPLWVWMVGAGVAFWFLWGRNHIDLKNVWGGLK